MIVIRYDLRTANDNGVTVHPQKQMKLLGYNVMAFEGFPIADCVFMGVDKIIEPLPPYLELSDHKII